MNKPDKRYKFSKENFDKLSVVALLLKQRKNVREIVSETGMSRSSIYKVRDCVYLGIIEKVIQQNKEIHGNS